MKALIKFAGPLMMLGFPTLIFAADTLRQLNAKSNVIMSSQMMPRGMSSGAVCSSESVGISAVGDVQSMGDQLYRCVTIFDERYQPRGSAWVEVKLERGDAIAFRDEIAFHH